MRFQAVSNAHGRFLRHPIRPLLVLLLLAALVRLLVALGTNGILWPDSFAYYRSAALMAKFGNFHWHEIYRTPLFPMFMAPFLWAFGQTPATGEMIIAAQHMLGIASVLLIYLIARRSLGPTVSFYGGALFSIHTLQLYYEAAVHTEALFTFVLLAVLFIFQKYIQHQKAAYALGLGFACAALTLTRPIGQFLLLVLLGTLWIRYGVSRRWVVHSVAAFTMFIATLLPWMITNKIYYRFFGVSQDLGLNLFHRLIDVEKIPPVEKTAYPQVLRVWKHVKDQRAISYFLVYHGLLRERVRKVRADRMMAGFALEALRQDSWAYLDRYLKNSAVVFYRFFFDVRKSVQFCGSDRGPYMCTKNTLGRSEKAFPNDDSNISPMGRRVVYRFFKVAPLPMAFISGFALLGFAVALRRIRSTDPLIIAMAAITLYFAVLTAIFNIPEDRFRLPADSFLIIMFIFTVIQILGYCRQRISYGATAGIKHFSSRP